MEITPEPKTAAPTKEDPLLPLAQELAAKPGQQLRVRDLPSELLEIAPAYLAMALEKVLGEGWTVEAEAGDPSRTPESYLVTAHYRDAKAAGIPEDRR